MVAGECNRARRLAIPYPTTSRSDLPSTLLARHQGDFAVRRLPAHRARGRSPRRQSWEGADARGLWGRDRGWPGVRRDRRRRCGTCGKAFCSTHQAVIEEYRTEREMLLAHKGEGLPDGLVAHPACVGAAIASSWADRRGPVSIQYTGSPMPYAPRACARGASPINAHL
jgi:hypothetical protein